MAIRDKLGHPDYLGLQIDWPLFIRKPFQTNNKEWKKGEFFNWTFHNVEPRRVALLYSAGFIQHDTAKETTNKVGDRLNEMNHEQLKKVFEQLNMYMKQICATSQEFQQRRCKGSKIDDKQRGLIRQFLRNNPEIKDEYDKIRDYVLKEPTPVEAE